MDAWGGGDKDEDEDTMDDTPPPSSISVLLSGSNNTYHIPHTSVLYTVHSILYGRLGGWGVAVAARTISSGWVPLSPMLTLAGSLDTLRSYVTRV